MSIPQTDYSIKTKPIMPKYKFSKLYQQTGGQVVAITTSQESVFELPPRCMNLRRSALRFTATPSAGTNFNYFFASNVAAIRQVQLYTRGGAFIADSNKVDYLSDIMAKTEEPVENVLINDVNNATIAARDIRYGSSIGANSTPYDYTTNNRAQNTTEPLYIHTEGAADTTATPVLTFTIPLSQFYGTIMALDKDLYFNEVILLKIVWNDAAAWGANSTATNNRVAGAEALTSIGIAGLELYLALQQNELMCAALINTVRSTGLKLTIPYVYSFRNTSGANSTSQMVSIRLNRMHGSHLKKIYHVFYHLTDSLSTRYSHTNVDKAQVVDYYTSVDNARRQEFNVSTASNEDWLEVQDHLKGTVINNLDTYRYNWFVLDKFDDQDIYNKYDCIDAGLDLSIERKWDIIATTANTRFNQYTFAIVARELSITPAGLFIQ
jgi:hypothetical protein